MVHIDRLIYMQLLRDHNWGSRPAFPGLSPFSRLASFNGTFALWKPPAGGRPIVSTSTKDKANRQNNADQSWVSTCFLTYCFKLFISRNRALSLRWLHDVLQGGECPAARRKGHGCVSKSFNPNIKLSTSQNQLQWKYQIQVFEQRALWMRDSVPRWQRCSWIPMQVK